VRCEPPGVHAHRLLILLICGNISGRMSIDSPTEYLHPAEDTGPQTRVTSMGRLRIMVTSYSVTVVSPHERWNVWVSGHHRSTSSVNATKSIIDRLLVTSRARSRNPVCCMNSSYRSSHVRGLCVRILSGCKHCGTQQ
jgi:hypothetical protein